MIFLTIIRRSQRSCVLFGQIPLMRNNRQLHHMSQLKFLNTILCDFASVSAGNKHTLVNIYSGNELILAEAPVNIALASYLELVAPKDGDLTVKLSFRLNDQIIASVEIQAAGLIKGSVGVIMLPPFPFSIAAGGELRLIAEASGYAKTTLIRKKIVIGAIPSPIA